MAASSTHVAYADESYSTRFRYRSVAVVTLGANDEQSITQLLKGLLRQCGLGEFKWAKLRQARERFTALRMLDALMGLAMDGRLRVDVLMWDTHDSRHRIKGRDDVANLQRMYYHLLRNVLQCRWPAGSTWQLYPDENSALDWMTVRDCLDAAGLDLRVEGDLLGEAFFRLRLARDFRVLQVCEARSLDTPICQLADLFAGLGAYSHSAYTRYEYWLRTQSGQMSLGLDLRGGDAEPELSNSDCERCAVMKHLDEHCKRRKLRVALKSTRGFRTRNPAFPVNFWLYESQHPDDKAPVRAQER